METLQTIQNYLHSLPINEWIAIICIFILLSVIITYEVARYYQQKKVNSIRADIEVMTSGVRKFKKQFEDSQKDYNRLSEEFLSVCNENTHILKVNQGMCLRKAAISKEIIDDLNLRKTAIGEALRVVRENNLLKNNHPDILKMIADEIYSYLTSKQ
jgi:hypothetical protein